MPRSLSVAVLGATGAVGTELLRVFESRKFPARPLKLLASERSAGTELTYRGAPICVEAARESSFGGIDLAFFSAGAAASEKFARIAIAAGAAVIDNSSAFRMDDGVPLVVPEINSDSIGPNDRLFAVPNCTAIVLCMALAPLRALGTIERVVAATYQSASGGGAALLRELEDQTRGRLAGDRIEPRVAPHPYAFNLFSHTTPINEHGYNGEEWKVIQESKKILGMPDLRIGVTCVRVPVLRAHSVATTVEFADELPSEDSVRAALTAFPGVRVVDDRDANRFPMPSDAEGQGDVLVGRIRRDVSHPSAISLFACGDQLLKGAALNAVQIAEELLESGRL